ncbi:MAG TPA: pentapeptide repeat-containing protein [Anaerolineales bacterium]|nr:pentapeptide repeat-containing protein [Anaerolineales bacterium]
MTNIILSETRYTDQEFKDLHLDGIQINSSDFVDCTFSDCSFVESGFKKCRFVNCDFKRCDLSLTRVPESIFNSTSFEDSKIIGVNWAQADWSISELGKPISFLKSAISHCTFIGLSLKGIQVVDCAAVDVDYREADLSRADFSGSDLSASLFMHTNLSEANLSRARNYAIDPGLNELKEAKFSLPEAMSLLYSMNITLTDGENET